MTEALLFDYNGVITDDEEQHRATFAELLAEAGIALTRDQYYADYLGCDDRTSFVHAFRRAGKPLDPGALETLVARKSRAYARLTGTAPALVAGAAAFVRVASSRFRMGLVSGAQRREIEPALARAGLADCFEVIVAGEDVARCKPDPGGYLAARAALARGGPVRVRRATHAERDDRRGCLGGATGRHGRLHGARRRARSRAGDLHPLRTSPLGPPARRGGGSDLPAGWPARVRGGRGRRPRGAACARARAPARGRRPDGPRHGAGAVRPAGHHARGARRVARRSARGRRRDRGRARHARAGAHPGGVAAARRRSGRENDPAGSSLR